MSNVKVVWEVKDVIKLVGLVLMLSGMWWDLKTDYAVTKATVELRLNALENKQNEKTIATYQHMAIMPSETKIEGE